MLKTSELDILRASALVMRDSKEAAAATFYDTLFQQSPELRALFPEQMTDQSRKFAATLAVAVNSLADWEALRPIVEALARRHLTYGVKPEHYETVGHALITTLQNYGARDRDIVVWEKVYGMLSDHMKATAYPPVG